MKDLYISQIKTEHKIDQLSENLYAVVTEDDHLIIETDLKEQHGWTEARHRRICATGSIKLRIITEIGSVLMPDHIINMTVYKLRKCEHCDLKMKPTEISSHPGFEVHDHCWPDFVRVNPDLFPEKEDDDEYA